MMTEIPPTHRRITGWKILMRCLIDTMNMAAIVATKVAIMQGTKISVGFTAGGRTAARAAMIETGMSVSPEACKHKNMICALDARSLFGFISCKLCIAFSPKGVAALSRPRRLAEKFIIIWPMAG